MGIETKAIVKMKRILAQSGQAYFDNCLNFGRLSSNLKQS
jgi:hypothetical protein